MLYISPMTTVRTLSLSHDKYNRDRMAGVAQWHFFATTVTAEFQVKSGDGYYYVLWCNRQDFASGVHRSKAVIIPDGTQDGDLVKKTIYGFPPESGWFFRLVRNPDSIEGEQ